MKFGIYKVWFYCTIALLTWGMMFGTALSGQSSEDSVSIDIDPYHLNIIGISLGTITPEGSFKRHYSSVYFNGELSYLRQVKAGSPLFLGGLMSFTTLQTCTDEVERDFIDRVEIWDGSTTVYLTNFKFQSLFFLKKIWKVDPYLKLYSGMNWTFAGTTLSFPDSDESSSNYNGGSIALTYGGALGLMTLIQNDFYLNFTAGYHIGGSSRIFTKSDDAPEVLSSTFELFDQKKSTTNHFSFHIGASYIF